GAKSAAARSHSSSTRLIQTRRPAVFLAVIGVAAERGKSVPNQRIHVTIFAPEPANPRFRAKRPILPFPTCPDGLLADRSSTEDCPFPRVLADLPREKRRVRS